MSLQLVKLGGSVLTNKAGAGPPRFHASVARQLAREIKGVAGTIVVHGAGSWGHPLALRHKIGTTRLTGRRLVEAVTKTQASVARLRRQVVETLLGAGVPAVEVASSGVALSRKDGLRFDAGLFKFYVEAGFVPVSSGDVVLDEAMGVRVLSGDEILRVLATALGAQRVIFASDIDGAVRGGKVLPTLRLGEIESLDRLGREDATGGLRGKLLEAAPLVAAGIPVLIVNGRAKGRLRAALSGRKVKGTQVVAG